MNGLKKNLIHNVSYREAMQINDIINIIKWIKQI